MANYKRKKPRRACRCTLCTQLRWMGNSQSKKRVSDIRNTDRANSYAISNETD